jgi:hypothetical protein
LVIKLGFMRIQLYLLILLGFLSCNTPQTDIGQKANIDSVLSDRQKSIVFFDTTLINNGLKFEIKTKRIDGDISSLNYIFNNKEFLMDTIYPKGILYIECPDFDKDGNSDILIDYIGNNSTYWLYLFDSNTNQFKAVENYWEFPDAVHLKSNSKYYYSYHRAGCADMNWESDLFKIENFKIIHLGNIDGQGCDFEIEKNPRTIRIEKIINNDKGKLIEELPYEKALTDTLDKWDFIEYYWNKNYQKFDKN